MLSELDIFWLLLPLAALSGWWIGRSNQEQKLPLKDIYPEYFKDPLPTRSTIVKVLPTFLKFELDCVAYAPNTRQEG